MARKEIIEQLRQLPIEASAAFGLRVGLRVLPWLAIEQGLFRGVKSQEDRARYLYSVFAAFDVGLMAVLERRASGLNSVAQKRRMEVKTVATTATSDTNNNSLTDVDIIGLAYAVAAYATGNPISVRTSDTAVADIVSYAATYAYDDVISEFNLQIKHDLAFLGKDRAIKLIESPIWENTPPAPWVMQSQQFRLAVGQFGNGFVFWLEWYDALCRGDTIDTGQLKQRVFLPDSVGAQTPQHINAYFASMQQGTLAAPLNRVRTIFIGDGEAGKTSLIRVLNQQEVVEGIEPKTPGIDIREWQIPGTEIKASFWDFGGQVMVHATHQLFLRESCLYVLLVSAREKEKATERAEYWLEHVKSFGNGAPVLIVANKADKEPVRLDEGLLMDKYPGMIKGFFQLACTEANGAFHNQFEQFQQAFCQQLQAVGLHQVMFEKAHFAVLQNLRQRTPIEAFITHQAYSQLCKQHKVDAHGVLNSTWLLDILDKLGVIVHFPGMVGVEEYILNPRWLTYGVYTVMYYGQAQMTRQEVIMLLGSKPVHDLDGKELSYPAAKCLIIFEAMRRYKLCYFLPRDPDQLIIPALLPSDMKRHDFATANPLEFHYQFESFLPTHLISEMIVECHQDIAAREGVDIVWQHGVLLESSTHHCDALIQADYHLRRLTILLTPGPAAADFLAVLRHKVEGIVKRIHIKYSQNIRLPHEAMLATSGIHYGEQEWADFEQILAQRDNREDIYTHKSRKRYSISKILGIFTPTNQAPSKEPSMTQTVIITNSTISGGVNTAKVIKDSFNNLSESKVNDNLRTALDQLLQEISKLQQAASAEQAPQVAKAAKAMARVVEDSAEAQTDRAWYQVSWPGLCDALTKLGIFGTTAVALAAKVQPLLSN